MQELISCPVCTLYLRPGMSLEEHLETHPKDQVIRALVALATQKPESGNQSQNFQTNEMYDDQNVYYQPIQSTPTTQQPQQFFIAQSPHQPQEQHQPHHHQPRQNVMIVNRHSTMVYHAATATMGREQPSHRIAAQPTYLQSPNLQDVLNLSHHNQRQLPPPPAYGTAINQLRSQQNQSFIGLQNNQNALFSNSPHRPLSANQELIRNIDSPRPPRPSPSPSVLRYAESPISAQYVERDNGDFLMQESPRHVVECIESDSGKFSVVEKIVQSPPCVVQFVQGDSDNHEYITPDYSTDVTETFEEAVQLEPIPVGKGVKDVQIISNVKLDPTESLSLMENLGNINAPVEHELIWSTTTNIKSEMVNELNQNKLNEKENIEIAEMVKTSSSATSVIRLASNKPTSSQSIGKEKPLAKKDVRAGASAKRPFRKQPKKLTVKFKVAIPNAEENSSDEKRENATPISTVPETLIQSSIIDLDVEVNKMMLGDNIVANTSTTQLELQSASNSIQQSDISDNATNLIEQADGEPKSEETDSKSINLEVAHPMIVHEPSLSQEPYKEFVQDKLLQQDTAQQNKEASGEIDLSRLLEQCVQDEKIQSYPTSDSVNIATDSKPEPDRIISTVDNTNSNSSMCNSGENVNSPSLKDAADSSSFNTLSSVSLSKPSTSSSFALCEEQQSEHQPKIDEKPLHDIQQTEFNEDYPFGLLYGCANAAEDQPWSRYVIQQHVPQYPEVDNERRNYMDLDIYKITSCDGPPNTLNIRTDEKMPAKGEISEQESNGDVDNSWSNPHFVGSSFRFVNSYESWPGTTDGIVPFTQTFASELKSDSTQNLEEPIDKKPILMAAGVEIGKTSCPRRTKHFQCAHCELRFPLLKERNAHLIERHGYKRINRRLVRESPPSTITTENIRAMEGIIPIVTESNAVATITSGDVDDIKPDVKPEIAVSTTFDATVFPRTKYDSIRAGVYRMLMNFNLNVLKSKNIEVDPACFVSKSFCCFSCKRDFISVKLYDEHLNEHPAECFTCGKKFTRWTYFSLHLKRHLGWKDFACSICEKKFVIRSALIEHMRMHTGIAPLKCNLCDKHFKRYSNLTQHKKLCHSTRLNRKKDYVCYCGEVLPSKARFLWHKETHETRPKVCPYCRDRFVHRNSLKRHIRLTHSDKFDYVQPVKCKECKQVYAKTSMKAHMLTHSIDTQYECSICNKSFSTKWNLKIHTWVHANRASKPFKCEQCVKAFVREIDYKNHINSHKNIKPFTCEYCGCKFVRKYNYMRHRQEHTSQKRFKCDLCGKLFHRNYYLIEHRRMHTGERPFLCTICGKSSTTKTNHNKHLRIHHSRDPFTSEA